MYPPASNHRDGKVNMDLCIRKQERANSGANRLFPPKQSDLVGNKIQQHSAPQVPNPSYYLAKA